MFFDDTIVAAHESRWQGEGQFATFGFAENACDQATTQRVHFQFRDRAFQTEQQPAIDRARIIHTVAIGDQAAGMAAEIEQLVPVGAVAGEARRFISEDHANLAQANLSGKLLKAESTGGRRGCATGIVIDDEYVVLMPSQLTRTLPHRVLQPLALGVVAYLMRTRLSDVNHGPARQMTRLNQIGTWHGIPPEECGSVLGRLLAGLRP